MNKPDPAAYAEVKKVAQYAERELARGLLPSPPDDPNSAWDYPAEPYCVDCAPYRIALAILAAASVAGFIALLFGWS